MDKSNSAQQEIMNRLSAVLQNYDNLKSESEAINAASQELEDNRKECQKYPDFKLCDKNYEAEITDERFELELKKYIISVDGEEKKEEEKDEKADFISNFLRAYKSNLVLSILLTIALFGGIGVLIYYFVIKRRKNNVDPSCK